MSEIGNSGKRSYTVPILLVIIVVLATLIIIFYSKLLLTQQTHTTDQGLRLSESYNYAALFADRLHNGADELLNAESEVERLHAMRLLGEATVAADEATELLLEAAHLTSGQSREEAAKPILAAMTTVIGINSQLAKIGEHEGPLTKQEITALTVIRDGVVPMKEELNRFRPPSGEAGYRQMITVGDWINPALEASQKLEQIAAKLNEINQS